MEFSSTQIGVHETGVSSTTSSPMYEVDLSSIASLLLVSFFLVVSFSTLLSFVSPWDLFLCSSAYPGSVAEAVLLLMQSYDGLEHPADVQYFGVAGLKYFDWHQVVAVELDLDWQVGILADIDLFAEE